MLMTSIASRLSRRVANRMNFIYGKVYGSYGLCYETELVIETINEAKETDSCILDVGANNGDYSSLLAKRLGKNSIIHSFEPSTDHQKSLQSLEDQYKGRLIYHAYALSSGEKTMPLFKGEEGSGLASFYDRDVINNGLKSSEAEVVSATTLDAWHQKFSNNRISFLKVDVEGHELEVFKGGENLLSSGLVKALQFEFGGCNIDSRTYFKDFHSLLSAKHGFRLYRLAPGKKLVDLSKYKESLECFTWQNIVGFSINSRIPRRYTIIHE